MVIGACGSAVTGVLTGLLNAAWLTEAAMARYQTSRGVVWQDFSWASGPRHQPRPPFEEDLR